MERIFTFLRNRVRELFSAFQIILSREAEIRALTWNWKVREENPTLFWTRLLFDIIFKILLFFKFYYLV